MTAEDSTDFGLSMRPEDKARRLAAFRSSVDRDGDEMVRFWAGRSAAEHAEAGARISDLAARVAAETGRGKDPGEMFPGLSSFLRSGPASTR